MTLTELQNKIDYAIHYELWTDSEEGSYINRCSFGESCSFGERCTFGQRCRFEGIGKALKGYPYLAFIGAGSRAGSKVYFFNLEKGIYVRCGCYLGTLSEFRGRVISTKADELYLQFADIAESRFNKINGVK